MEQELAARAPVAPREDVTLMEGYYSPQVDVEVRLNTNEAPQAPPAEFVERLAAAVREVEYHRYPEREATELVGALARHHGVDATQVYCANGSNEVLQSLLLAYGGPGRQAAVFEPTYALHSHIARVTGTEVLSGTRGADLLIDEREADRLLHASAKRPAITFICSPNNPTGRVEPFERIERFLDASDGLVIVDEAYGQFAPRSAIELLTKYRNLVVVRTFSKTWSLAALRLGYALADPEVVEALWRVTLPYHLDAIKQQAGLLALDYTSDMTARVERIVSERTRVAAALSKLAAEVVPSEANFILFRVRNGDAKAVWRGLVERSVLVRDVSGLPFLDGFLRVTIGTQHENDRFLAALADVGG